jgi:hypothetical protein
MTMANTNVVTPDDAPPADGLLAVRAAADRPVHQLRAALANEPGTLLVETS